MNRLLVSADDLDASGHVVLSGDTAWHIRKVLKLKPGDTLRAGILQGPIGTATIVSLSARHVELKLDCDSVALPLNPDVLILALPRPRMMNRLWSLAASLGIGRILVTGAGRVEKSYFDSHVLSDEVKRRQLIAGMEQGGASTDLPETRIYTDLSSCLATEILPAERWLFHPGGIPFRRKLSQNEMPAAVVAIGPEGGWLEEDIELFQQYDFETISMGPRLLRTETACLTVLGALSALRE
jgi:RsmE family RNA methyltransferase